MARLRMLLSALLILAAMPAFADDPVDAAAEIKRLNGLTGNTALDAVVREYIKDGKKGKAVVAEAVKLAKDKPKELKYNAALVLATVARGQQDYASARPLYELCAAQAIEVMSPTKIITAYENLIDVCVLDKKYEDAEKILDGLFKQKLAAKDIEIAKVEPFLRERMVEVLAAGGKTEEALKQVNKLVEQFEGYAPFVRLKGDVLREAEKYEEAEKTYLQALRDMEKGKIDVEDEEAGNMKREIRRVRYSLSGVYTDMKKIDLAAAQLQKLLDSDPDNPTYNNDLGYIWADHDMKLDEAEKLILKALEQERKLRKELKEKKLIADEDDKDNAAYLDSLGWVYFKKKKYAEAKKELLEAVKQKEGQHLEIMDHLGDTYLALGEKSEAIKIWEKCKELKDLTRREKVHMAEVEKKLAKAKESK